MYGDSGNVKKEQFGRMLFLKKILWFFNKDCKVSFFIYSKKYINNNNKPFSAI